MDNSKLKAYTDGSYKNGRLGWGFVIVHKGEEIDRHCGLLEGPQSLIDQNNMAAEMKAAMMAAAWAKSHDVEVEIISDQKGVECWATGEWRRKNEWTKKYHKYMSDHPYVDGYGDVEAHSGQEWNELADSLAKAGTKQEPSGDGVPADSGSGGYCPRCCEAGGPDGRIKKYYHYKNGICFNCWGSGDAENPADPEEQLKTAYLTYV